mgnify:CR=1 FL=1
MKKKKLLKKIESLERSFEALIAVVQRVERDDRQQTANLVESEKSLQKQITRLWAHVQSERRSSDDELREQIEKLWRIVSL